MIGNGVARKWAVQKWAYRVGIYKKICTPVDNLPYKTMRRIKPIMDGFWSALLKYLMSILDVLKPIVLKLCSKIVLLEVY